MRRFITVMLAFTVFGCGDDSSDKGKASSVNGTPGNGSSVPVTQNPDVSTCEDILACSQTCETETCLESCKTQAGPTVARNFEAVGDCIRGCNSDTDCIASVCDSELRACGYIEDDEGGGGGVSTHYGCGHAVDCVVGCEEDSCFEGCLTPLDQGGIDLLNEVIDCLNICETDDCGTFCESEFDACFADV